MGHQFLQIKKNPIIPFLAITANWLIIASCIALSVYAHNPAVTALAIIVIGARQHGLFVLVHEATHGHIAPNGRVNDWISDLFCAFPLLFDTGVYRKNHLAHHRHLNSEQDPDWMRKKGRPGWTFPFSARRLSLAIPVYILILGPLEILTVFWGFSGFGQGRRWKSEPLFLTFKLVYFAAAAGLILRTGLAWPFALYWLTPMLFVLPFVTRVRNLSEHFAVTYEDDKNSTREVAPSWLEGFLLTPHNVNYHLTHHTYPYIPFYRIRAAHEQLVKTGEYAEAQLNTSYFFPFQGSVLADVLNGPKKPKSPEKLEKAG
jgi:fatty acid desaturase